MSGNETRSRRDFSPKYVLGQIIEVHNGMATEVQEATVRHNAFKAANPDQLENPAVAYQDGFLTGKREALTGVRAMIERVQAELEGDSEVTPGATLAPPAAEMPNS